MKTLKEVCIAYNEVEGYDLCIDSLYETFIECLSGGIVQSRTVDEHRWYDLREEVHEVNIRGDLRYFLTPVYHITGDNNASDMGLPRTNLSDVREVYPEEVTKTIYR